MNFYAFLSTLFIILSNKHNNININSLSKFRPKKRSGKDKPKKNSKRKRKLSTSSSESCSDTSNSSSDMDTCDEKTNWAVMYTIWPIDKRPTALQNKEHFNSLSLDQILALAKFDLAQNKAVESDLSTSFTREKKPTPTNFKHSKPHKDDGFKQLHPARFQRYPLGDIKDWWKKMPRTRSHSFKNLPLMFSGSHNKITQKTIHCMHDRTKPLSFKHFHSGNLNVASRPLKKIEKREEDGVYSTLDFNWEAPTTLAQVSDAILNYCTLLMHLWPYDQTGLIIQRVMIKYNYVSSANNGADRVTAITTFFNLILRENAARAGRKELIMSFTEQEDTLKTVLASMGISSAVPTQRPQSTNRQPDRAPYNNSRPANQQPNNTTKTVIFRGYPICFNYNNGSCKNTPIPFGCRDQRSREFSHNCLQWLSSRNSHCFQTHPRIHHR